MSFIKKAKIKRGYYDSKSCCPWYNERDAIETTHAELKKRLTGWVRKKLIQTDKIIYFDNGSIDNTWEILRKLSKNDPRVKTLVFSNNFGHR